MRYRLSKKLAHIEEAEVIQQGEFLIEILTTVQYQQKYDKVIHQHLLTRSLSNAQYCKADLLRDCVVERL